MTAKTPVSILQEYATKAHLSPQYDFDLSGMPDYFDCTVTVGRITALGRGNTKQNAKHQSAFNALQQLGVIAACDQKNHSVKPISNRQHQSRMDVMKNQINHVGLLNEFASTNKVEYPIYEKALKGTSVEVQCQFLQFRTFGTAVLQKDAKQDAARKMLEVLKTQNTLPVAQHSIAGSKLTVEKQQELDEMTRRIQNKIESMNLLGPKKSPLLEEESLIQIVAESPIKTMQELRDELSKKGYQTNIEAIQTKPYILKLTLEGRTCVLMGGGNTYKEALDKLFEITLFMFVKGYNFRLHFEEVPFQRKRDLKKDNNVFGE